MRAYVVPANRRDHPLHVVSIAFLCAAQELAIRRAARDAHRSECSIDAFDCNTCRMHAACIAEAKAALGRTSSL